MRSVDVQTNPSLGINRDYYEHLWTSGECSNGLPPAPTPDDPSIRCLTSLRWAESCGADHDWEAIAPEEVAMAHARGAGVRWYSRCAMSEYSARVAVDYFCPRGPTGREFPRRLHRCTFNGISDLRPDLSKCEKEAHTPYFGQVRHAGQPPPGRCMSHVFKPNECSNGLPDGECLVSLHRFKECGDEKNLAALGPGESPRGPAVLEWYNGLQEGPCGSAAVTVDYYCHKQCVRRCENDGVLDPATCTCACPPKEWWTGVECHLCGAKDSDCRRGLRIDNTTCTCYDPATSQPGGAGARGGSAGSVAATAEAFRARKLAREQLQRQLDAARAAREAAARLLAAKQAAEVSASEAGVQYSATQASLAGLQSDFLSSLNAFLKSPCAVSEECPLGWSCPAGGKNYCTKACASEGDCPLTWRCAAGMCAKPCEASGDCPASWVCDGPSVDKRVCSPPTV